MAEELQTQNEQPSPRAVTADFVATVRGVAMETVDRFAGAALNTSLYVAAATVVTCVGMNIEPTAALQTVLYSPSHQTMMRAAAATGMMAMAPGKLFRAGAEVFNQIRNWNTDGPPPA